MTLKERTFWLDTLPGETLGDTDPLPEQVDVAVIGAGFTGLSAARGLARRGARVAVLEAETPGWGASSRNGGMALTGLKPGLGPVRRRFGLEMTRRRFQASLKSIDCVERLVREEQIECDYRRDGHLEVAWKAAHFHDFAAAAEMMERDFGHTVRLVPRERLSEEIGSSRYYGGLVDEASAGLNPARYVHGLAQAAVRAGARLCNQARVLRVERAAGGFRLETARGAVQAREVLVGTNGYTGPATPRLQRRVIPIGSYIIATAPLPEALAREVSPRGRMIFDSKKFLYYFRLTPDNRMLFGGRAAFFPETPATVRESAAILERGLAEVYPQLRGQRAEYVWGGTLDFAFDMLPHAGQLDGLHYALGYAGHGLAMATYQGELMAEKLCGGRPDNPFTEYPFPGAPLGLYDGRPWFLPLAGAWHRFLDLVQ